MDVAPPLSFGDIVEEIVRFADLPREEVERRVWREALEPGWNVMEDVARFGVTRHRYDERMARLYREGDGFVFETLVAWPRPGHQRLTQVVAERIARHAGAGRPLDGLRVLMLGDGTGNDSLYMITQGLTVDYFDVPGSRTSRFATKRFDHRGLLPRRIRVVTDYESLKHGQYDVVVSLEVLEHLEDPLATIRDIGRMLRPGGIALITEGFGAVSDLYPTHLAANRRFEGRTPFLFLANGMRLAWHSTNPYFKPMEFVRTEEPAARTRLRLAANKKIASRWLSGRLRQVRMAGRRLWQRPVPA